MLRLEKYYVFVALTSKWCRRQSRQHQQMRGSRGGKWTGTTSDWPSRAFAEPDSWARRNSGGKNSRVLDLFLLISASVICFTHLFQVKEQNQLYYLNCRQKWCKQHPEPGQKTDGSLLHFRHNSGFLGCASVFGLIPSESLSIYELQHVPSDIEPGLPPLLQQLSGKESGGRSSAVSRWALNDQIWIYTVKRLLASTGTLPKMCEAPWRQSPRGEGDKVLVPRSSPSTAKGRTDKHL